MNVKQYEGSSIAEALAKVKGELGSQAVILHTRSYRKGGLMGLWAHNVVEITASTNVNIQERRRKAAAQNAVRADDSGMFQAQGLTAGEGRDKANTSASRHVVRNAYAKMAPPSPFPQDNQAPGFRPELTPPAGFATTREMAAATLRDPGFELRSELADLKTMVESLLQRTTNVPGQRSDLPEELSKAYLTLLQQQVAEEIAWRVIEDVKSELHPTQLASPSHVKEKLTAKLAALIPSPESHTVARPLGANLGAGGAKREGCRSICLIGPTGVGKTTTIAKLAAALKLRQKLQVGLITIDTYRIAAVDQLRTYANIIGVPLKVVLTPAELAAALHEMRHLDTVLIDTAGRSPSDDLKLNELAGFIQAANPTEVHLVLSSTCTQQAMEAALAKFSAVRVDQIIFTKLDEAVSFGVLLNVARKASKTLSYLTTGQDVPDHVEVGQPRRLAKLILGDKL